MSCKLRAFYSDKAKTRLRLSSSTTPLARSFFRHVCRSCEVIMCFISQSSRRRYIIATANI